MEPEIIPRRSSTFIWIKKLLQLCSWKSRAEPIRLSILFLIRELRQPQLRKQLAVSCSAGCTSSCYTPCADSCVSLYMYSICDTARCASSCADRSAAVLMYERVLRLVHVSQKLGAVRLKTPAYAREGPWLLRSTHMMTTRQNGTPNDNSVHGLATRLEGTHDSILRVLL